MAFLILKTLCAAGNIPLMKFFSIGLFSISIVCGVALFLSGVPAVRNWRFYEQ